MELSEKIECARLVETYGKLLTPKQLEAVSSYYLYDLGLSEIAENLNISRQGVYDLVNKSTKELKSIEEKVQFLKTKDAVLKEIDKLMIAEPNLTNSLQKIKNILE